MVLRLFRRLVKRSPDCREVRDAGSDYIDGNLGESSFARIRAHLDRCGPCTAFIKTLTATVRLLRAAPRSEPPPDFTERLRDRLSQERGA